MYIGIALVGGAHGAGHHPGPDLTAAILEQLGSGVVAFDHEGRTLVCNARARDLLSLDRACTGTGLADVLPASLAAEAARALSLGEAEAVARFVLPNGRAVRWRTRRLDGEHRFVLLDEVRVAEHAADGGAAPDPLTGLGSRDGFAGVGTWLARPGAALVMLDLDRFKQVNDTLGHPAGDAVLRLVGQRITGTLRAGDRAFRLGGDEFAVVLPDGAGAEALAERLVELLSRSYLVGGHVATVGASAGIAYAADPGAHGMAGPEGLVPSTFTFHRPATRPRPSVSSAKLCVG